MLLKVLLSDVPIEFTAATITMEIPAAINAYSIAVAPALSFAKRVTRFLIGSPVFYTARRTLISPPFDRVNWINESRGYLF
jgi:hypothetical protein